jgi:hypothetical protein
MNGEEAKVMNRLLKKLTALRATLPDDERALLDGFILTRKAVDEVEAHVFDPGLAKTPAKVPAPDEVEAHVFDPGLAKIAAPHPRYIIVFDTDKEIYRVA